jgi:hypothetical protein
VGSAQVRRNRRLEKLKVGYIAETVIPLMAFGIPLSPIALGPAAPLFNAPPVFTTQPVHNLHNLLVSYQYLLYGFIGIIVASLVAYPFSMNYARRASAWVLRTISQEACPIRERGVHPVTTDVERVCYSQYRPAFEMQRLLAVLRISKSLATIFVIIASVPLVLGVTTPKRPAYCPLPENVTFDRTQHPEIIGLYTDAAR